MKEIDFMSSLHKSTKRDYLARVNDKVYPKAKAASLAKKFDYDYWDGDREYVMAVINILRADGQMLQKLLIFMILKKVQKF